MKDPFREEPLERLRRVLTEGAVSQESVARCVGVTRQAVSLWFLERARPTPTTIRALVGCLERLERKFARADAPTEERS